MNSKNKTKFIFIFSLALLCYSSVITKENVTVKVGIETHKNKFRFTCGEYKHPVFIQTSSGKIETIKISQQVTVKLIAKNKIKIGNKRYSLPVKLYSAGNIVINNNFYPGEIELIPTTNGFNIVNTLSLQQYLYGVIPYEIEPTWTDEMLKIQSIISRTYALANLGRHKHDGFDFCNTMHCQVYKGLPRDESFYIRIKKYIDITDGLV
ncbi:MAG: SpoIID/LytB domain-containing protein, partial [Endomicrobia bacterium]|nr:SpoIID/LytB domain-containing protein [Endomicrobiia bacterium]